MKNLLFLGVQILKHITVVLPCRFDSNLECESFKQEQSDQVLCCSQFNQKFSKREIKHNFLCITPPLPEITNLSTKYFIRSKVYIDEGGIK